LKLAEGPWLWVFLQDKALLQGQTYQDEETGQVPQNGALPNMLRLSSTAFIRGHFVVSILESIYCALNSFLELQKASEFVMNAVCCLPASPMGQLSTSLRFTAPSGRHLHFLSLSRVEVLQYCTKLLTSCLQVNAILLECILAEHSLLCFSKFCKDQQERRLWATVWFCCNWIGPRSKSWPITC
jgi:hypothetical protein